MKEKGFTLMELLAVITILTIIALIASAIILNVINTARKNAFVDTAYSLIDAARVYRIELIKEGKKGDERAFTIEFTGNLSDVDGTLDIQGKVPDSGTLKMDKSGNIELAIWSDSARTCVTKDADQDDVQIDESKTQSTCKL